MVLTKGKKSRALRFPSKLALREQKVGAVMPHVVDGMKLRGLGVVRVLQQLLQNPAALRVLGQNVAQLGTKVDRLATKVILLARTKPTSALVVVLHVLDERAAERADADEGCHEDGTLGPSLVEIGKQREREEEESGMYHR